MLPPPYIEFLPRVTEIFADYVNYDWNLTDYQINQLLWTCRANRVVDRQDDLPGLFEQAGSKKQYAYSLVFNKLVNFVAEIYRDKIDLLNDRAEQSIALQKFIADLNNFTTGKPKFYTPVLENWNWSLIEYEENSDNYEKEIYANFYNHKLELEVIEITRFFVNSSKTITTLYVAPNFNDSVFELELLAREGFGYSDEILAQIQSDFNFTPDKIIKYNAQRDTDWDTRLDLAIKLRKVVKI